MVDLGEDSTEVGNQEVGEDAVWVVSSAKPGFGAQQLRDDEESTYWQSDGPQPHWISIQFHKRRKIEKVMLRLIFQSDESYTPRTVSVMAGNDVLELQEVCRKEFEEPSGWVEIALRSGNAPFIRANMLRVVIKRSHQNGKDCHVRGVKVYSPYEPPVAIGKLEATSLKTGPFQQFATVR